MYLVLIFQMLYMHTLHTVQRYRMKRKSPFLRIRQPINSLLWIKCSYLFFEYPSKYLLCLYIPLQHTQVAQLVRNPSAMQETPVRFLGQEEPLEKG